MSWCNIMCESNPFSAAKKMQQKIVSCVSKKEDQLFVNSNNKICFTHHHNHRCNRHVNQSTHETDESNNDEQINQTHKVATKVQWGTSWCLADWTCCETNKKWFFFSFVLSWSCGLATIVNEPQQMSHHLLSTVTMKQWFSSSNWSLVNLNFTHAQIPWECCPCRMLKSHSIQRNSRHTIPTTNATEDELPAFASDIPTSGPNQHIQSSNPSKTNSTSNGWECLCLATDLPTSEKSSKEISLGNSQSG